MATTGPTVGGYATHIPNTFHTAFASKQAYDTMPISTSTENAANTEANRLNNALKARKRTKTGCLTCRKRRIKCGEERPTCKNCTKSKRDCEGYIPRVVFKEPGGGSGVPLQGPFFAQGYASADAANMFGDSSGVSADGASYQAIAPRPSLNGAHQAFGAMPPTSGFWTAGAFQATGGYTYMQPYQAAPQTQAVLFNPQSAMNVNGLPNSGMEFTSRHAQNAGNSAFQAQAMASVNTMSRANIQRTSMTWPYSPASTGSHTTQPPPSPAHTQLSSANQSTRSMTQSQAFQAAQTPESLDFSGNIQPFLNEAAVGDRYLRPIQDASQDFVNEQLQSLNHSHDASASVISQEQEPEDDWFDVDSEDEVTGVKADIPQANLGMIIARNAQQSQGDFRSLTNFLDEADVLSTYNPAYAASPLKDPKTAQVFCHFITATGPTLHVCERHPSNPAVIFSGCPVPKSQQALWSYTLPMLALRHQGLLHSMLALSSLHIAKLQESSPTPSLRHYHYALRRVAKALGDQRKRRDPATLAATLLLGYYEVTTAEHNKWNSHLSGARELIMDIPYIKLAKRVDAYRRKRSAEETMSLAQKGQYNGYFQTHRKPHDVPTFSDGQLDQCLISSIMGWDTRHGETGRILNGKEHSPEPDEQVSAKDVDMFETQLDLFWWYAKQDTYQSILSGNRLLLSYDRWAMCPPRASIGRIDAVYGTMDHLLLLMARLADWAGKDISRKKRAGIEAERAAKAARNSPPSSAQPSPSHPPPMYGIIPDPGPVRVPSGFSQEQHDKIYTAPPPSEFQPLDVALNDALAEWSSIAHAYDVFFSALGPSYEPLSADHMTPLSTPFGPALYFRSYGIACVLHLYHCGRIILARTHPKMPPAAMVCALVARSKTEYHANAIGRICAGIQPVSNTAPLNPHHGAALMDCCMGLFHASVQFTDPAQRAWTITKLRDVARLTGWQTSSLIAAGCERAWIHYASIGRGPPYERTMNKIAKDDRVAGRSRDPEHLKTHPKDNNDRRFVKMNAGTRVYWAMGILSVEEDMMEMNLGE